MENLIKFANFYKSTSTFGTARIDDIESPNSEILNISTEEFLNELYVNVPMESFLEEKLTTDTLGKLIAVCGPAGSGKSSISYKVKENLKSKNYFIVFLDFKIEFSTEINDDNTESIDENRIRKLILNTFSQEFPLSLTEDFSKKDKFIYFLLSPEPEYKERKIDQVFLDFVSLQDRITLIYKKYTKIRKQTYNEWYLENHNLDEVIKIKEEALKLIDISHYVHYIVYSKIYEKVIIWIDNIDSFSNLQQTKISGFLHRLERSILNLSQIVISVREENIYRYGAFNEKYSEPFTSIVSFADKLDTTPYGAINIPVISNEYLKKIITQKIKYCHKLFKKRFSNLTINENLLFEFENLAQKLSNCFENEKTIFLANNSIREYLSIHSKFLCFLTENNNENHLHNLEDNELKAWQLTTKFLSWVYTVNEPFKLDTFNVLEEVSKFDRSDENGTGCFLPYLILTRIWNECNKMTGQNSPNNNPELKNIINDIVSDFNYSEELVLNTLNNLLQRTFGQGNFITLRDKIKIEKSKDLKDIETTVRITYRGKVTVGSIINSYGYFLECTNRVLSYTDKKRPINELLLEKIENLFDIHFISLSRLKEKNYANDPNWYEKYLLKYGVLVEVPFVRNKDIGIFIHNNKYRRALYIECLMTSLLSYFNYHDKIMYRKLSEFNAIFNKKLNQIT